jgi:hypothetical protein
MGSITRFQDEPLARARDPVTSHEAAADLANSGTRTRMCRIALQLLREFPGATAAELDWVYASRTGGSVDGSIRKRLTDLRHTARARVEGHRQCRVSGRQAQQWFPCEDRRS